MKSRPIPMSIDESAFNFYVLFLISNFLDVKIPTKSFSYIAIGCIPIFCK